MSQPLLCDTGSRTWADSALSIALPSVNSRAPPSAAVGPLPLDRRDKAALYRRLSSRIEQSLPAGYLLRA
jgi:hypothetical protein